ncbi:MAG: glycerol-3-phosphate acyltransferase [Clostridia bacterium]|nr:glycerol-3-phosphate acyltransferase [Clostridia bacterium]MBQ6678047.1 glycerol-3-phosphate acyltransferase [Clostridia bacterium]
MDVFLSFLLGYAVGMINPSYIIGRIRGFDIRKRGSGNAGGSNALITMGKVIGLLCILFDLAKAALVTWGAARIFPECALSFPAAAVGVVLGHVFPPYMKFRGGKGFACLGGAILAFNPLVFLIMLGGAVIVVLVTDYICFVPLTASVAFPIVWGIMKNDLWGALMLCIITAVIFFRHIDNFKKIKNGKELKFSYLWKKDSEMKRIGAVEDDSGENKNDPEEE